MPRHRVDTINMALERRDERLGIESIEFRRVQGTCVFTRLLKRMHIRIQVALHGRSVS